MRRLKWNKKEFYHSILGVDLKTDLKLLLEAHQEHAKGELVLANFLMKQQMLHRLEVNLLWIECLYERKYVLELTDYTASIVSEDGTDYLATVGEPEVDLGAVKKHSIQLSTMDELPSDANLIGIDDDDDDPYEYYLYCSSYEGEFYSIKQKKQGERWK